jgi:hypothetical protein
MENVLGILFGIGLLALSVRFTYSYFIALHRDRKRIEAELEREKLHRQHWLEWQGLAGKKPPGRPRP